MFRDVLIYADALGLIGKDTFAIGGCKLPSNASKQWSGTHEEPRKKQQKYEAAAKKIVARHRDRDCKESVSPMAEQDQKKLVTYKRKLAKIKAFLKTNPQNIGPSGTERKSNLTDNDSAKMKSSHGVIQGYDGVAVVDRKHQVIVHAEAFGQPQEHELLEPMVQGARENFQAIGAQGDIFEKTKLTADAGFHTEKNMEMLFDQQIDGYVADTLFRKRDAWFQTAARHKPNKEKKAERFTPQDFIYDSKTLTCICPAGKRLYLKQRRVVIRGYRAVCFMEAKRDCDPVR